MPCAANPATLAGLLVSSRSRVIPRSARIAAAAPYSRRSAGNPRSRFASTVSRPASCRAYALILARRPIPRPSCPRRYTTAPPSMATRCRAVSSCGPQSQRTDPKASPVRHSECTRTRGTSTGALGCWATSAAWAAPVDVPLVRVHSECLTGDAFGSVRCDCGPQLDTALQRVSVEGGAVVYLRGHEGRGIGLLAKISAYALQDAGRDTVEANLDLGFPAVRREYGAAAAILADLGITRLRLLTNNPAKVAGLAAHGIDVEASLPIEVGRTPENLRYLRTKAQQMGHLLSPETFREDVR